MKDDQIFMFISRIIEDPLEPIFNRLGGVNPRAKTKYKKSPVYDRNNRLIPSDQEDPESSRVQDEKKSKFASSFYQDLRLAEEMSQDKNYAGEKTPDDSLS